MFGVGVWWLGTVCGGWGGCEVVGMCVVFGMEVVVFGGWCGGGCGGYVVVGVG